MVSKVTATMKSDSNQDVVSSPDQVHGNCGVSRRNS
jgi:hypothetical protein